MPNKLRKEEVLAELTTVQSLLMEAIEVGDVLGANQFKTILSKLSSELEVLAHFRERNAAVALFFGGPKVAGSMGIDAEFAGQALDRFQDLVSKSFARRENGDLGSRGPVPTRHDSSLMVTAVTRGSFGFVLEEVGDQQEAIRTQLSEVVENVTDLIANITNVEEQIFTEAAADMDMRLLTSTRGFFKTLDNAKASLRIVEGEREIILSRADIERGRERTEALEVEEQVSVPLTGMLLGLLPVHRRFEFVLEGSGENISGKVASDASRNIGDQLLGGMFNPLGRMWVADFNIRDVLRRGRPPMRYYTLLRLVRESDAEAPPPS
jgi:hypothetical protein